MLDAAAPIGTEVGMGIQVSSGTAFFDSVAADDGCVDEGAAELEQTVCGGSIEASIGGGLSALADENPAGGPPPISSLNATFEETIEDKRQNLGDAEVPQATATADGDSAAGQEEQK